MWDAGRRSVRRAERVEASFALVLHLPEQPSSPSRYTKSISGELLEPPASVDVDVPAVTAAIPILRQNQGRLDAPFVTTRPCTFPVPLIAYHNHLRS